MLRSEQEFRRQNVVSVVAAVVGISRARWLSLPPTASNDDAVSLVQQHKFDVIPIAQGNECREYFITENWASYSAVQRKAIGHSDVIAYDTHIRDVVKQFAQDQRSFFFLSDEGQIVGLISVANLNCRQMAVFVFALLVELELRLGEAVSEVLGDQLYVTVFDGELSDRLRETKDEFDADVIDGVDASLIEYLYLSDLIGIAVRIGIHTKLGYSRKRFESVLGSLNDLRNKVAHPARSLVDGSHPVAKLWERLDKAEELLFALR